MAELTPQQFEAVRAVWRLSVISWSAPEGQMLRIPFAWQELLGNAGIDALMKQFSSVISAPARIVMDNTHHQLLIKHPDVGSILSRLGLAAQLPRNELKHDITPLSISDKLKAMQAQASEKRKFATNAKTPRPANQFVLYRKDHHSAVVAENPGIHNNDVSRIIGKMWTQETDDVKAIYKAKAEKLKLQHAVDNPGYQYNPRKPGEKKRRKAKAVSVHPLPDIATLPDDEALLIKAVDAFPEITDYDGVTFLNAGGLHFQVTHPSGSKHQHFIDRHTDDKAVSAREHGGLNLEENQISACATARLIQATASPTVAPLSSDCILEPLSPFDPLSSAVQDGLDDFIPSEDFDILSLLGPEAFPQNLPEFEQT